MKIGIVGNGVVGGAIMQFYAQKNHQVFAYDKDPLKSHYPFEKLKDCDAIFVSVPTLTMDNGNQDLMPLLTTIQNLNQMKFKGLIIHKCTVVPGTTRYLQTEFKNLRILHCPEFLTERNSKDDYKNAKAVLLSGADDDRKECVKLFGDKVIHEFRDYESTEIAKYMHNCFLATKVSFFNEMFDVCKHYSVGYASIISALEWMGGIGHSHMQVPGPDGKRGWGGMCFPKDTRAFVNVLTKHGIWPETLAGAIKTNRKVRNE